jgi:membrane carboxypeptidase/penicillin-binding protein
LRYEIFADQRRTPIQLDTLPKYVIDAHLAAEQDFYKHSGFSWGIPAPSETLFPSQTQGGSTHYPNNWSKALLSDDRTSPEWEFVLTIAVVIYSKDQIWNDEPGSHGGTAYGLWKVLPAIISTNPPELILAESAFLAGLPKLLPILPLVPPSSRDRQQYVLT